MTTVLDIIPVKDQGLREVGIEIEMEGRNLGNQYNYWAVKADGSLRGESCEFVLKRPAIRKVVASRLSYLQNALNRRGAELIPSDRCGVHIHINFQRSTMEHLFRFATLYYIFENALIAWCGKNREGNLFCLRAQDADFVINQVANFKRTGRWQHLSTDQVRYAALNWKALSHYGSLEQRAMESPKDFNQITTWINMLLAIKDYAKKAKTDVELVEHASRYGPEDFIERVMGKRLAQELLGQEDLDDKIITGSRLAQNIAYAPMYKFKSKKKTGVLTSGISTARRNTGTRWQITPPNLGNGPGFARPARFVREDIQN